MFCVLLRPTAYTPFCAADLDIQPGWIVRFEPTGFSIQASSSQRESTVCLYTYYNIKHSIK